MISPARRFPASSDAVWIARMMNGLGHTATAVTAYAIVTVSAPYLFVSFNRTIRGGSEVQRMPDGRRDPVRILRAGSDRSGRDWHILDLAEPVHLDQYPVADADYRPSHGDQGMTHFFYPVDRRGLPIYLGAEADGARRHASSFGMLPFQAPVIVDTSVTVTDANGLPGILVGNASRDDLPGGIGAPLLIGGRLVGIASILEVPFVGMDRERFYTIYSSIFTATFIEGAQLLAARYPRHRSSGGQ